MGEAARRLAVNANEQPVAGGAATSGAKKPPTSAPPPSSTVKELLQAARAQGTDPLDMLLAGMAPSAASAASGSGSAGGASAAAPADAPLTTIVASPVMQT